MSTGGFYEGDIQVGLVFVNFLLSSADNPLFILQELIDLLESHTSKIEELLRENQSFRMTNSELQAKANKLSDEVSELRSENDGLKLEANNLRYELQHASAALATSHQDIAVEMDDNRQLDVPHTLNDRYILGEKLGEGGYSIVKAGVSKIDGSRVAIKIITRKNLQPDDLKALYLEVKTLQNLQHDHIVRAFDFFEEKDYLYVVMECIEGGELFDRIVAKTCYNEKEARDLVFTILNVLKYCHSKNIIHR
jgi:hypothetical protein